ncbi:uncharacterized protein B0H18DRAFT_614594 [Fomitopsis serialis]|uniref:uncharacterized protein n=1 Tax=Fomitopsis serialis TaxID=139415 RepID=UPI0020084564|nr:uncharacterized protein B0H18DRAFT_614594 [Neoantrodia serialis]KAH9920173.1 hypothetical protein B0H18DRAFT_614594 [Neoantrodia serialis]
MPLFHSSNPEPQPAPAPAQTEEPQRSRSLFSRRGNSPDAAPSANGSTTGTASTKSNGGFFSRRRSSSSDDLNDIKHEPSVVTARQRVADAEAAEREADRALIQARAAVRGAREHVRLLEQEAIEEWVAIPLRYPCGLAIK